jgi:hypothetical protein
LSRGLFTTVETYAVIDWGFNIHSPDGGATPAGAVLRQAHTREYWNFNSNLRKKPALEIELFLRKFGVTSTGLSITLRNQPQNRFELINIQGKGLADDFSAIVDFGTFIRMPKGHFFSKPLAIRETKFGSLSAVAGAEEMGANQFIGVPDVLLDPKDPTQTDFVHQAIYEDMVPVDLFSVQNESEPYPELDKLSIVCEEFVKSRPSKAQYAVFIRRFLCTAESLLASQP